MLAMTGYSSNIAREVREIVSDRYGDSCTKFHPTMTALQADRYFFCQGLLLSQPGSVLKEDDIALMLKVNCSDVIAKCEYVFMKNDRARICVMGSYSGVAGSFDRIYSSAKAGLHQYVETRKVGPLQQLVAVAPGIIENAGMTIRRLDFDRLEQRRRSHPKGRFITCKEVAKLVVFLLYEDEGYLSNITITMNGGEHCR